MGNLYKHRPIIFRKTPMHHLKYQLRQSQGILPGVNYLGRSASIILAGGSEA